MDSAVPYVVANVCALFFVGYVVAMRKPGRSRKSDVHFEPPHQPGNDNNRSEVNNSNLRRENNRQNNQDGEGVDGEDGEGGDEGEGNGEKSSPITPQPNKVLTPDGHSVLKVLTQKPENDNFFYLSATITTNNEPLGHAMKATKLATDLGPFALEWSVFSKAWPNDIVSVGEAAIFNVLRRMLVGLSATPFHDTHFKTIITNLFERAARFKNAKFASIKPAGAAAIALLLRQTLVAAPAERRIASHGRRLDRQTAATLALATATTAHAAAVADAATAVAAAAAALAAAPAAPAPPPPAVAATAADALAATAAETAATAALAAATAANAAAIAEEARSRAAMDAAVAARDSIFLDDLDDDRAKNVYGALCEHTMTSEGKVMLLDYLLFRYTDMTIIYFSKAVLAYYGDNPLVVPVTAATHTLSETFVADMESSHLFWGDALPPPTWAGCVERTRVVTGIDAVLKIWNAPTIKSFPDEALMTLIPRAAGDPGNNFGLVHTPDTDPLKAEKSQIFRCLISQYFMSQMKFHIAHL